MSSSDGIGAKSFVTPRWDSTISRAPSSMASETCVQISFSLLLSPAPPADTLNVPLTVTDTNPGYSPSSLMCTIRARSSLPSTGNGSVIVRQCAGVASSRFCSGPRALPSEVTSSSRIASSGGFVTCANSWLK